MMMMHISRERKNYLGMLSILQSYERDLAENAYSQMVLDGRYKDKDACKWLRLKHQVYSTERKNVMERFIQKIKEDRTECFIDDHFPCRSERICNRQQHVTNWIKMFILIYI